MPLAVLVLAAVLCAAPAPADPPPVESADPTKEGILAQLGLGRGMTVAEIGAGAGWFALRAAEVVGPTGTVYATDIDERAVERLRRHVADLPPTFARVEVRQCRGPRDTALDDLPDDQVDVISMIDSLCFDRSEDRATDVDYLRRLWRILRPGGHLVHHMDCRCAVTPAALAALFAEAGFGPPLPFRAIPQPPASDPLWECRDEAQRARHAYLGIFPKPAR